MRWSSVIVLAACGADGDQLVGAPPELEDLAGSYQTNEFRAGNCNGTLDVFPHPPVTIEPYDFEALHMRLVAASDDVSAIGVRLHGCTEQNTCSPQGYTTFFPEQQIAATEWIQVVSGYGALAPDNPDTPCMWFEHRVTLTATSASEIQLRSENRQSLPGPCMEMLPLTSDCFVWIWTATRLP